MKQNIVLVGFMGSGKSTLGRLLEKQLGWPLISTDGYIEKKQGRKIAQIFKDSGEIYFRELEHEAIKEIGKTGQPVIVDCGGGVILNPDNIGILKQTGTMIFLSCDPEVIYERVLMQPKRPLLDVPDLKAKIELLLKERMPLYQQADVTIDTTDGDMHRVAKEVISKVIHE